MFIQRDQPAAHERPVGGPLWPPISHPLCKIPDSQPKFPAFCSELHEPVLQQDVVRTARPGPAQESLCDCRHRVIRDVHGCQIRGAVGLQV